MFIPILRWQNGTQVKKIQVLGIWTKRESSETDFLPACKTVLTYPCSFHMYHWNEGTDCASQYSWDSSVYAQLTKRLLLNDLIQQLSGSTPSLKHFHCLHILMHLQNIKDIQYASSNTNLKEEAEIKLVKMVKVTKTGGGDRVVQLATLMYSIMVHAESVH